MSPRRLLPLVLLAAGCASAASADRSPAASAPARFAATDDATARQRLSRDARRLPAWARTLVETLPATTAHQVNLDHAQRARNPLGPVLAAQVRWTVADALRCAWAKESAEADLAAAGVPAERIARLGEPDGPPEADRAALAFARKLTLAGSAITDREVADLIAAEGADDVVALVHTVAHANFQQRIVLALGLTAEPGGAVPALQVAPPPDDPAPAAARPPSGATGVVASSRADLGAAGAPPPWSPRTFEDLRAALDSQKARTARIAPPDAVRLARLPRPLRKRLGRIAWGTVSLGYQPELTGAWFRTMDAFEQEAKLDPVFASSLFWVVTRTNDCFY